MKIVDIINGPWAITPTMLQEIQRIYASHLHRAEKIDIAAIEAATGKKLDNSMNGAYVSDGVAVIPMYGVVGKRMNLFTQISGGASTELITNDYLAALNDPAIKAIVLHIDSPGGTVDGTQQMADIIAANRGAKPVIACADGMMCSAAYWIGSAADSINIADMTTDIGSIGVVAAHMDISGWEEKQGIKTTEITAGKYKRAISQYAPLSEEGRAIIQADLDQIYQLFVDTVAGNRGCSVEDVLANMAEGRVFLGAKAIEAGLVDSVATLADTIQQARELGRATTTAGWSRASAARAKKNEEETTMTLEQFKADHSDLYKAIIEKAEAEKGVAVAAAIIEGRNAEHARIAEVRAQIIPGHEALIESLAFDGKSTGADAAKAIVAAEQGQRNVAAKLLEEEANKPAMASTGDESEQKSMKRADFNALSVEAQREAVKSMVKIID